jgi:hypothetical protein
MALAVCCGQIGQHATPMPIAYERDDQRRLIIVTATMPYSDEDILSVIDRQAAEETWGYAMLYDMRAVTNPSTEADLQVPARVKAAGGGRERGPVGLAVGAQPDQFRMGLRYTKLTRTLMTVEVLLTPAQVNDWLLRNARGGSSRQP